MSADPKQAERRLRYQGRCHYCESVTDGSNGRAAAPTVCADCKKFERRVAARRRVVRAVRAYVDQYGQIPSAHEWRTSATQTAAGRPGPWPLTGDIQQYFGSWNAAIRAAGYLPQQFGVRRYNSKAEAA